MAGTLVSYTHLDVYKRQVRWISPFTWAVGDNQLVHGLSVPELGALIAVGLVMVALCLPAMRRLDIH